ncbi:hypothetical protein MGYG_07955 [Nannizzia gypsea CBS 118893]|uniref:Secreted protein n=1 Tax=Arthroderma gypseum (strain ATCC MYA-4604 / CBS 118893) TaxID=535722 RepID=E4V4M9_ARTGP|nr:hypothetical protein MGYG_07955 [Nannizzia gypsea CBS 118893]EFR04953.1 hypothetical protein MGYG_07955 [Nannizzia gypsea CBS 118893]
MPAGALGWLSGLLAGACFLLHEFERRTECGIKWVWVGTGEQNRRVGPFGIFETIEDLPEPYDGGFDSRFASVSTPERQCALWISKPPAFLCQLVAFLNQRREDEENARERPGILFL